MKLQRASLLALLPLARAGETIVGVYMFHRHGDRTPKVLAPTNLTALGYREVFTSGQFYHARYIDSASATHIMGISSGEVNLNQIAASAPIDNVLQNSAEGFLQGLYPPLGVVTDDLVNSPPAKAPMDGYQLIPVEVVESGSASENSGWLQDATTCLKAEISSNEYFSTPGYTKLLDSTMNLYQSLLPTLKPLYDSSTATYFNAYLIYDYLNVARIHNKTLTSYGISDEEFRQLHVLANTHEYNLAYNSSSTIRAIAGKQLAAEIVDYFAGNIEAQGAVNKMGVQFGAYGTFLSFFGLAQLPAADPAFTGIVNYASAMTFELYTAESFATFPSPDQLRVRFLFHNGTTTNHSAPQQFPLFGSSAMSMSWADFQTQMGTIKVGSTEEWCHQCGNTTGSCAPFSKQFHASIEAAASGGGMSNAVAGVIGAMVTLAVVLGVELLIYLVGGFRIVKKNRLVAGRQVANGGNGVKA